jgi:hypothetical protein
MGIEFMSIGILMRAQRFPLWSPRRAKLALEVEEGVSRRYGVFGIPTPDLYPPGGGE